MPAEKIKVIDYSGYRGEEAPRSFVFQGTEIKVSEILSMWIEEELEVKVRKRFFHIKGTDGYEYKIYYDEKIKEWFLIRK
jgi:hypothetical protein